MTISQSVTWLERAQALGPLIQQYRDEAERERHLPRPVNEAMLDAGLFGMMLSQRHGGSQAPIEDVTRVIEEVARHDGSTGWNLMIGMHMAILADYFQPDAAQEIFGPPARVVAGTFQPKGRAERVDGGYRVSGQWPFASGSHHASYFLGSCVIAGRDPPELIVCCFPSSDYTIIDTWHTTGLRGTGSNDIAVEDVFVPVRFTFPVAHMYKGPQGNPDTAQQRPFFDIAGPTLATVSLGIARDAIDSFIAMAAGKLPARATWTLDTMHVTHRHLGEAEAFLRAARAYIYEVARMLDGPVGGDADATAVDCRLASANATQYAMRAVDLVHELAGGTSVYEASHIERCFRDVHMPSHHTIASASHYEMVGQYLLGHGLEMRR